MNRIEEMGNALRRAQDAIEARLAVELPHVVRVRWSRWKTAECAAWLDGKATQLYIPHPTLEQMTNWQRDPDPIMDLHFASADDAVLFKLTWGGA